MIPAEDCVDTETLSGMWLAGVATVSERLKDLVVTINPLLITSIRRMSGGPGPDTTARSHGPTTDKKEDK